MPALAGREDHKGNIVSDQSKLKLYETVYIVRPNLDEEGVDKAIAHVEEFMKKEGCEIVSTEKKGRKRLAYEVKKMRDGYYVHTLFNAKPETIVPLRRMMTLSEDVIRELVISVPKVAMEQQS